MTVTLGQGFSFSCLAWLRLLDGDKDSLDGVTELFGEELAVSSADGLVSERKQAVKARSAHDAGQVTGKKEALVHQTIHSEAAGAPSEVL